MSVLIDHPADTYAAADAFGAGVAGSTLTAEDETYSSVTVLPGGVKLETQRLGDPSTELRTGEEGYVILTDPGGLVFCVVPVQTGADFEEHAVIWE